MDTFFEQIIAIRKDAKAFMATVGIWVAFLAIVIVLFFLMSTVAQLAMFSSIIIFLIFLLGYFAVKLTKKFSIEYEYIITNGTFDVDKIIAKSSRKRMMSFELSNVETLEKFNSNAMPSRQFKEKIIACNLDDANAYYMIISEEGKGSSLLVFAPDERIRGAVKKFLPKYIANSAFREV